MKRRQESLWAGTLLAISGALACGGEGDGGAGPAAEVALVLDVHPGESIQAALELAAKSPAGDRLVRVHAGTYRPDGPAQALVWFNKKHDGIVLTAVGEVTLTAANPDVANPEDASYPALVNHVVYFGDGVSSATVLRGFRITGANNFVTRSEEPGPIEPFSVLSELNKALFFYADGGGIKIFGRSYPRIEGVTVFDNYASPCAGGASVEHRGFTDGTVLFKDCVFRDNTCQITGSAIDLLPGSSAIIENCLFVGNVSNTGQDFVSKPGNEVSGEHGSGALTVFPSSKAVVRRSTFTGNWNGVDDQSPVSTYEDSIFWRNDKGGGIAPGARYELDVTSGAEVAGCYVGGEVPDLRGTLDSGANVLDAPDPEFDAEFRPQAAEYAGVGYRPPDRSSGEDL